VFRSRGTSTASMWATDTRVTLCAAEVVGAADRVHRDDRSVVGSDVTATTTTAGEIGKFVLQVCFRRQLGSLFFESLEVLDRCL